MSVSQIVTYGFGTFGSVNKVPTHGFDIEEVTLATGLVSIAFGTKSPSVGFASKASTIGITTKSPSVGIEVN